MNLKNALRFFTSKTIEIPNTSVLPCPVLYNYKFMGLCHLHLPMRFLQLGTKRMSNYLFLLNLILC